MDSTNFEIKDNIYLNYQGVLYDLHNDYDFINYKENQENNSARLNWKLGSYEWVKPNQPKNIELEIKGITKFKVEPGRIDATQTDQVTLEEIAYLTEAEWCNGPFTTPKPPETSWDWVFIFV